MVKAQLTDSVRILKELLEKVPVIEDIQIIDRSERGFTVIFRERGNSTVKRTERDFRDTWFDTLTVDK